MSWCDFDFIFDLAIMTLSLKNLAWAISQKLENLMVKLNFY